jgi:hypothetical protein
MMEREWPRKKMLDIYIVAVYTFSDRLYPTITRGDSR